MGLVMDAPALAQAGYVKTSDALALANTFRNETECKCRSSVPRRGRCQPIYLDLVLSSVGDSLDTIAETWWETDDVKAKLNAFRRVCIHIIRIATKFTYLCPQKIFSPVVERLGFEYSETESVDTRQLRTRAINTAAMAGDEK